MTFWMVLYHSLISESVSDCSRNSFPVTVLSYKTHAFTNRMSVWPSEPAKQAPVCNKTVRLSGFKTVEGSHTDTWSAKLCRKMNFAQLPLLHRGLESSDPVKEASHSHFPNWYGHFADRNMILSFTAGQLTHCLHGTSSHKTIQKTINGLLNCCDLTDSLFSTRFLPWTHSSCWTARWPSGSVLLLNPHCSQDDCFLVSVCNKRVMFCSNLSKAGWIDLYVLLNFLPWETTLCPI